MNLIELVLVNFRRYEKARFKFHSQFTVLIGENGKGKTAILDALAIMLGTYFQGSGIKTGAPNITQDDARLMVKERATSYSMNQKRTSH
jgi:recombinational DNA repair ATPase RecF